MLRLYIANKNYSSWSLRPWLLMSTLDIPFEEVLVPFGGQTAPEAFQRFSPTGKVPCLVDGGNTIWDSLAIIEYLAERFPGVWPQDPDRRAWARCASAEMHAGFMAIRDICTMNCGLRVKLHGWSKPLDKQWQRIDSLWQQGLHAYGGPFLAGEQFSAVDAFYAPLAFRAQTYTPALSDEAQAYAARLLALPAMQLWYQAALLETWRDEEHEQEARQAGVWLADLRAS
ncbi:glutathione S-transferase family protein [Bowmanella sp. Y26]|uniref:glutathione S-transferase family protein n=1 Tax=Bowmanella yangjiangensis TaxID=2811230 RepID=UPI001BDC08AE|nr:glutathione S-transferase family protein [Bowmanella yangjiangensis]